MNRNFVPLDSLYLFRIGPWLLFFVFLTGRSLDFCNESSLFAGADGSIVNDRVQTESKPIDLAGVWSFQLDPQEIGESQAWFASNLNADTIQLPGTTDLRKKGYALDRQTMQYPVEHLKSGFRENQFEKALDRQGYLLRDHLFIGQAWYQREIEIPPTKAPKSWRLKLERVCWQSTVWLDDRKIEQADSLSSPHEFDLGSPRPGKHRLTIRVDNRMIHNLGIVGHSYTPETQSQWNGIVGKIELTQRDKVWIDEFRIFADPQTRKVRLQSSIINETSEELHGTLEVRIDPANQLIKGNESPPLAVFKQSVILGANQSASVESDIPIQSTVQQWSEFHPSLYRMSAKLHVNHPTAIADGVCTRSAQFGFRSLTRNGKKLFINDSPLFIRGTVDCCVYPKTGHPPMDREHWERVLGTAKNFGFNFVRFHSWCPPETAFEVADELGIYLAPETPLWIDDWVTTVAPRPLGFGKDPKVFDFIKRELDLIHRQYGNHPSFVMLCLGNELGRVQTDWKKVNELISSTKTQSPGRLYCTSADFAHTTHDDLRIASQVSETNDQGEIISHSARGILADHTDWDFAKAIAACDLPFIAHESGQRAALPDYNSLLPKFDGPLKPDSLRRMKSLAVESGIESELEKHVIASARLQQILYKAEHEACRRTNLMAGYQLLSLIDFPGQGEAYVGMLDPFGDPKANITEAEVRQWNRETVLLARYKRNCLLNNMTFDAELSVSHFGEGPLEEAAAKWSLQFPDGSRIAEGQTEHQTIENGGLTRLGTVSVDLSSITNASQVELHVSLGDIRNHWNIWVFPKTDENDREQNDDSIYIAQQFDERAQQELKLGHKVLINAGGQTGIHQHLRAMSPKDRFFSVFWNAAWWGDSSSQLGIFCDASHPAFAKFPNQGHSDWQFLDLQTTGLAFDLTGLVPQAYQPILAGISDFHYHRKLGIVFEARVGEGKLLISGHDLTNNLDSRLSANQFRRSLIAYMHSPDFEPAHELSPETLSLLFPQPCTWSQLRELKATAKASCEAEGLPASHAIDGDTQTFWHTPWLPSPKRLPHELIIDMNSAQNVRAINCMPRQDSPNGRIRDWELEFSLDGQNWSPVAKGKWAMRSGKQVMETITLAKPQSARYVKLIARSAFSFSQLTSLAELDVVLEPQQSSPWR